MGASAVGATRRRRTADVAPGAQGQTAQNFDADHNVRRLPDMAKKDLLLHQDATNKD